MAFRANEKRLPASDLWLIAIASSVGPLAAMTLGRRMPLHLAYGIAFFVVWTVTTFFMVRTRREGRVTMRRLGTSLAAGAAGGLVVAALFYFMP